MSQLSIDLVALFKFSFAQFKKYASFIIGAMLTYVVLGVVPQAYLLMHAPQNPTGGQQFVSFLLTMVQVFLSLGFTKIILLLVQDKFVEVADMFNNFKLFLSYFVASFLFGFATLLGIFLLVLPGIFVLIRFQFYPYFILEENVSSFTALKKSYYLSQNLTLELLLLGVAVVVLNVAGMLFFGVGMIFTYPLTTMATAIVYKSIAEEGEEIPSKSYRL